MLKRKIVAILIATSVLVSNMTIVQANQQEEVVEMKHFLINNIDGVYRKPDMPSKIIEKDEDMNFQLKQVELTLNNNTLSIQTNIDNNELDFEMVLYPSQMQINANNKLLAISNNNSNTEFEILKFTIEKNADESNLLETNIELKGKTVVSFAIYNTTTLEEYYVQFPIEDLDFERVYDDADFHFSEDNIDTDVVLNTEIAYFSLQPLDDFTQSFSTIDDMNFGNSESASVDNEDSNSELIQDLQGETLDRMIEDSKNEPIDLSLQTYSLISNIPDSVYKKQTNGTWTNSTTGYDKEGNMVGYTVYHMNDSYSGNVMNYVLRYYCTSKFEWNSNEFQTSFNLSHNVWVQYIKSKNSVVVFDDRASNARIKISPEIHISVDTSEDKDGYFVSRVTNAYKNGSMATKIARLIIGYVPYLKDVDKIYTTLSDKKYTENNNRKWFEKNYTKEVRAQIKDIKYAPNNKGYAQDYIGISISAKNVNAIKYGNSWTCSTT